MPSRDDANSEPNDTGYTTTFDPSAGDQASAAVVTAVAAFTGTEPSDLAPLYDVVEPDALDSLCTHADRVGGESVHRLWFPYEGVDVCVHSDGQVRVLESASVDDHRTETA